MATTRRLLASYKVCILLFVFNTVCYGYLRSNFCAFRRFLIHGNLFVSLYTQCLRYNIFSAWFLELEYQLVV